MPVDHLPTSPKVQDCGFRGEERRQANQPKLICKDNIWQLKGQEMAGEWFHWWCLDMLGYAWICLDLGFWRVTAMFFLQVHPEKGAERCAWSDRGLKGAFLLATKGHGCGSLGWMTTWLSKSTTANYAQNSDIIWHPDWWLGILDPPLVPAPGRHEPMTLAAAVRRDSQRSSHINGG